MVRSSIMSHQAAYPKMAAADMDRFVRRRLLGDPIVRHWACIVAR
jgi:hypothetical protein